MCIRDRFSVVNNAKSPPHIRDRIFIIGVKGQVFIMIADQGIVGDIFVVQLSQAALPDQPFNHIIRWKKDVIVVAAGSKLQIHFLVGFKERVDNMNARFLFKLG